MQSPGLNPFEAAKVVRMLGERNKKPTLFPFGERFVLRAMEEFLMSQKPTYEELEQRVRELESSEDELTRAEGLVQYPTFINNPAQYK